MRYTLTLFLSMFIGNALATESIIVQTVEPINLEVLPLFVGKISYNRELNLPGFYLYDLIDPSVIPEIIVYPGVISVDENRTVYSAYVPTDSRYNEQWAINGNEPGSLNLEPVWDIATGDNTVVAIVDTGLVRHDDLDSRLLDGMAGVDFITDPAWSKDFEGRDGDAFDDGTFSDGTLCPAQVSSWHGAKVQGIIAGDQNSIGITGVAYETNTLAVRAIGMCDRGTLVDVADAIAWAGGNEDNGSYFDTYPIPSLPSIYSKSVNVINLSISGPGQCSAYFQAAIDIAVANGITVVVAAGNNDADASGFQPGNCNDVINVGAVDFDGGIMFDTNYGPNVDIAAPGGRATPAGDFFNILTTSHPSTGYPNPLSIPDNSANSVYGYLSGTSSAAAHVTGIVALMYELNPNITPAQVEQIIKDTARPCPGICDSVDDAVYDPATGIGAGIIDPLVVVNNVLATLSTEPPVADYNYSCGAVNGVASCDLTDASYDPDGNVVAWLWDFGDGNTSTQQSPSHTFPAPAEYTICLTATDDGDNTDQLCRTIPVGVVPPPPPAPACNFFFMGRCWF